jgi:hypothetical protein
MKYGIMKVPPPYNAARPGKRKKFPNPTADPATARITPILVPQLSLDLRSPLTISLAADRYVYKHRG